MNPFNHVKHEQVIQDAVTTNDGSTNVATANIDTAGEGSWATIKVLISPGLTTDAVAPTISILQADDTVVSNFATITADKTLAITSTSATHSNMQVYEVDLRGKKRYLRLSVTPGTVATDDAVAINAVASLYHQRNGPASTTDMVASTNNSVVIA